MKGSWILKWESRHPYYRMEFYFRAEKEGFAYGSANKKLLGISRNNVMQCYYDENDQQNIRENSLTVLLDKKHVAEYFKDTEKTGDKLLSLLSRKFSGLSKERLKDFYKKAVKYYQIFYTTYDLSRPEYFEAVEKKLKETFSEEDFIVMTTPIEPTTLDNENEEFLRIVASQKKDRILQHQKKYGWISTSENDKPWDVDFYTKRFEAMAPNQAKLELDIRKKKISDSKNQQKEISVKTSADIRYLCDIVRKMAHVRLESRLIWAQADRLMEHFLFFIASQFNISEKDIFYYSEADVLALIDGQKLNLSTLAKRGEAFAFQYDSQRFDEYSGEQEVRSLEEREEVIFKEANINSIKGSIANKGYTKGRVRIISAHTKDQHEASELMQEGEILVTGMTRPHLIWAIRKAAAIITDEGGITSHAAIISRELNKPCIIGTRIATKVLKDGDLVEVDANKGVVKILERKK